MKNIVYAWLNIRTVGVRACIMHDDQILLIKHTYLPDWYLVGGGVNKGETPLQAIKRELMEEVGITLTDIPSILGVYHNQREGRDDYIVVYNVSHFIQTEVRCNEIAEARWFPLKSLPSDISPATLRRIQEYQNKSLTNDQW